jgi:hypothetical protein
MLLPHMPFVAVWLILAGQVSVGLSLSVIVTAKLELPVLPAASRTVYVIVVTPVLNDLVPTLLNPVVGELPVVAPVITHVNLTTEQLSKYVGLGVLTVALQVPLVLALIFAGLVTSGFCASTTVITCEQVFTLPLLSVAVHVTVVAPIGRMEGALCVTDAIPQLSLTVGVVRFIELNPQTP